MSEGFKWGVELPLIMGNRIAEQALEGRIHYGMSDSDLRAYCRMSSGVNSYQRRWSRVLLEQFILLSEVLKEERL